MFKKTLKTFLVSQRGKIPLNSNVGAFEAILIFRKKTIRKIL